MIKQHVDRTNVSISLNAGKGYIVLFKCLLIGQQSAKHPSIQQVYSLAFALFHVLNVKEITIRKLTWKKNIKQKYIYILHYKYVKCTSLYTSTKDGQVNVKTKLKVP